MHFDELPVHGAFQKVWWAFTRDGRGTVWALIGGGLAIVVLVLVQVQHHKAAKSLHALQSAQASNILAQLAKRN
jgi:hypothetical protein